MAKYQAANGRRPYEITLLIVAVAAAGFNLRTAITSLPPIFPDLQTQLHLSSATLSLLAATPVICFGVVSAFAAWLNRRYGEEANLLVALVLLTAGLLLRGAAPGIMLFPGTALAASAIAVLNVLLSSMVKRRWPERAGLLIGIYLTALSVGAILSSLLSVPLYRSSGGSVRLALGVWAVPAALAAVLWLPQLRYRTAGVRLPASASAGPLPVTAGVKEAGYVLLRLPLEVRDLFREWLMANYPDRYRHVFTLIRDMRGGRDYDSQWGARMKGTGPMAWMIGRRFEIACEKLGLNKRRSKLTTDHFAKPKRSGQQLSLF